MSIPGSLDQRMMQSYVESTITASKPLVAVANSTGTPIGTPNVATITSGTLTALNSVVQIDPTNYRMIYFKVAGTFSLTFSMEYSPDGGTTWNAYPYHGFALFTTIWQTSNSGSAERESETWGAGPWLMRVRASTYTSGTATVTIYGCGAATFPSLLNCHTYTQGYVAHDGIASGENPLLISGAGGRAVPTPVSADGDVTRIFTDRSGRVVTTIGDQFANITTATTTAVKAAAGKFERLIINKTLTGAVTVYNNTAASGAILCSLAIGTTPQSIMYGVLMTVGITVVTAAADDITVTYAD